MCSKERARSSDNCCWYTSVVSQAPCWCHQSVLANWSPEIKHSSWKTSQKCRPTSPQGPFAYTKVTVWAAGLGFHLWAVFFYPPMGSSESLGHIESGKIPGPLLIHVFPYRFTRHPRGSALSSCSLCSHHPEKDNIRQRNLTFDTQMRARPPDLNPARCGGVSLSTLTHAVMRGWDGRQRGEGAS